MRRDSVNCRQAQEQISPYLDQQLTGEQMMAVRHHLDKCAGCAEEFEQVREVRGLLRSLSAVAPGKPLETQITQYVAARPARVWHFAPNEPRGWGHAAAARPPRGRRLASGLALACIAMLILAAPFAPSTGSARRAGGSAATDLVQGTASPVASRIDAPLSAGPLFGAGNAAPQPWAAPAASRASQPPVPIVLTGWSTEPMDDEAVGGYAAGNTAGDGSGSGRH